MKKLIYYPVISGPFLWYFSDKYKKFTLEFKEKIRFYNKNQEFYYPYILCSAHNFLEKLALKDYTGLKEHICVTNPDCSIFIDSGGFQTLTVEKNKINKWSSKIALDFSEENGNIFPIYDKPLVKEDNNSTIIEKINKSCESAKYYVENRTKQECIILNVVSGCDIEVVERWYKEIRKYKLDGWAHGGNLGNIKSIVQTLILLILNGEFDTDRLVNYHIFGTASDRILLYLARIQYNLNKRYNIQLSCDSSSPILQGLKFGGFHKSVSKLLDEPIKDITLSKKYDYSKLMDGVGIPCANDPFIHLFNEFIDIKSGLTEPGIFPTVGVAICLNNLYCHIRKKEFFDNLMFFDCYDLYKDLLSPEIVLNLKTIDESFADVNNAIRLMDNKFINKESKSSNRTQNILNFLEE